MEGNPFIYNQQTKPKRGGLLVDALQMIVVALAISVVIYLFLAIPNQVDGLSMFPNLHDDDVLITNKLIQIAGGESSIIKGYNYQRGDIVVFQQPNRPDLVKRVIGLPGDNVKIENGRVVLNGQILLEDYIAEGVPTNPGTFISEGVEKTVPADSYFLIGDNRTNSKDSRDATIGFVRREYIKGSAFIRIFPFDRFGFLKREQYKSVSETN